MCRLSGVGWGGISKCNRERLVHLLKDFGQVIGLWLSDMERGDLVFVKEPGSKVPGPHAVRGYLCRLLDRAGLDKETRARDRPCLARRGRNLRHPPP